MPDVTGTETPKSSTSLQNDPELIADLRGMNTVASVAMVNRAHRVVRERAKTIKERRSKIRSLWLPVAIFSSLLIGVSIAVWTVLEEYELFAGGSQVASYQVLVPLLWSIPVSAALLAVVWFRKVAAGRNSIDRFAVSRKGFSDEGILASREQWERPAGA